MGRTKRGLYITARDKRLFEYLFLAKLATANQINRDIFAISDHRAVLRRLGTLVRKGFLKRIAIEGNRPRYGYYLSEASFRKYVSMRIKRPWTQLKSDSPAHDIALVDIRAHFLKQTSVTQYLTENAIESELNCPDSFPNRSFLEMHSDGAITLKKGDRSYNAAIEYEDSQKARSRYEEHFAAYYARPEIHAVIYLVQGESLCKTLSQVDKVLCANRKSKIFLGELNGVLNPAKILHFMNSTNDILKIE